MTKKQVPDKRDMRLIAAVGDGMTDRILNDIPTLVMYEHYQSVEEIICLTIIRRLSYRVGELHAEHPTP